MKSKQASKRDTSHLCNKRGGGAKVAKIRVCKVDHFSLPLFLMQKLRSVAQIEWKKHPYIFFLLSVQK